MKVCMLLKYCICRNVGNICMVTETARLVHPPRWRIATGFPWQLAASARTLLQVLHKVTDISYH